MELNGDRKSQSPGRTMKRLSSLVSSQPQASFSGFMTGRVSCTNIIKSPLGVRWDRKKVGPFERSFPRKS